MNHAIPEKQLGANRAKAQKSIGLRTAEGKRRSSLNAVGFGHDGDGPGKSVTDGRRELGRSARLRFRWDCVSARRRGRICTLAAALTDQKVSGERGHTSVARFGSCDVNRGVHGSRRSAAASGGRHRFGFMRNSAHTCGSFLRPARSLPRRCSTRPSLRLVP
jgi:hypothetical protein